MHGRERKIDGAKVKRLRDNLWLSQGELAEKAGVAIHTVSRMETGVHEYPRRSTIFAVAEVLGVRPEALLKPEDPNGSGDPLPLPEEPPSQGDEDRPTHRTG